MATTTQMAVRNQRALDEIIRARYERVACVIAKVIHDQAPRGADRGRGLCEMVAESPGPRRPRRGMLYCASARQAWMNCEPDTRRPFERLIGFARESPPTPEHLYAAEAEQQCVRAADS